MTRRSHAAASLAMMAASGFAGLGDQIVWTQQNALWLGHEAAAVLAVVAAFFGGLGVGALALGSRIERSAHPVRWYAACEGVIASWSVVLIFGMSRFSDALLAATGPQPDPAWQWTIAFMGTFIVLLPATAAMGATLPAIERVMAHTHAGPRSLAALYASNTLGATVGVLATAFWLVPSLGLVGTAWVCAACNAACAAASWLLVARAATPSVASAVLSKYEARGRRRLVLLLGATGLLGIGYEVLVVRVLSQVCEDTVYTFAVLLAIYLTGSAVGAAAWQRWFVRRSSGVSLADPEMTDRLLLALAAACLVGASTLWAAESVRATVINRLGDGMAPAVGAEAVLALLAFALPTVVMGAVFSHLAASANAAGIPFGRAVGINILGAAGAPLLFGVLLAPRLGAKLSLLTVFAGYLLLTTANSWKRARFVAPATVVAIVASLAPRLSFVEVPEGGRLVSYREGVMAAVSVVDDGAGVLRLRIDNREQEGTNATRRVDGRQALLPLLLHPAPRRALLLGLGTGVTASSAAEDPTIEVDAVELLPEVIAASRRFTADFANSVPNPRLHLLRADARRYVRTASQHYDLIVADNFHPARAGSGALYTVEHFRAVRDRLADGGLFCQWLPLHQLDLDTLRSIVRSFMTAYPRGRALLASNSLGTPVFGLLAMPDRAGFELAAVHDRVAGSMLPEGPAAYGIDDEWALLGSFVAGPDALMRFAGDSPANTDDRPVVAYRAPRVTYAPRSTPAERLTALLGQLSIEPGDLLSDSSAGADRLAAYWAARDRFIAVGRHVRPSSDVRTMLASVQEPLLAVLRISADFRPAYDPLVRMASDLGRSDVYGARALLRALVTIQPARLEARQALDALDGSTNSPNEPRQR